MLAERNVERERRPRVRDRALDLQPVANDGAVAEQPLDVTLVEARDAFDVEVRERAPVALTLPENRRP
jgi:hypothetical protein